MRVFMYARVCTYILCPVCARIISVANRLRRIVLSSDVDSCSHSLWLRVGVEIGCKLVPMPPSDVDVCSRKLLVLHWFDMGSSRIFWRESSLVCRVASNILNAFQVSLIVVRSPRLRGPASHQNTKDQLWIRHRLPPSLSYEGSPPPTLLAEAKSDENEPMKAESRGSNSPEPRAQRIYSYMHIFILSAFMLHSMYFLFPFVFFF